MTNIEFLIQIAKGFNPITGETFEETDILCQPEVSKRLLDLVKQLQEDEKVTKQFLQDNYIYNPEIENLIKRSEFSSLSNFSSNVTNAIKCNAGREIWRSNSIRAKIEKFLFLQGKIKREYAPEYRNGKYYATEAGIDFGITNELEPEKSEFARHFLNLDTNVQDYIIANLSEILKIPSSTSFFNS